MDCTVLAKHKIKIKESKNTDNFLDDVVHEDDSDTSNNWNASIGIQRFRKLSGGIGNQRKTRDRPDIKIGLNCEKNFVDMTILAITQTPL